MRVHFWFVLGATALFLVWVAPWQIGTDNHGRSGENWAFFATNSADLAVDLLRGLSVYLGFAVVILAHALLQTRSGLLDPRRADSEQARTTR